MRALRFGILAGCALAASATAEPLAAGWYAGASAGWTGTDADAGDIYPGLSNLGPTSTQTDDDSGGWGLFGGYRINDNFAVELGYADLGEFETRANVVSGTAKASVEPEVWCLSALGGLPLAQGFSVHGRLGVCYWDDNADTSRTLAAGAVAVPVPEPPDGGLETGGLENGSDGTDLSFGLGAGYTFANGIGLRAEWTRYQNVIHDDADVDLLGVSVLYNF